MKLTVQRLRAFAETDLPPDVVMALECAEDETGDGLLGEYGGYLRRCAAEKRPVLPGRDREILLRQGKRLTLLLLPEGLSPVTGERAALPQLLERAAGDGSWQFLAAGFGSSPALAEENAVKALAVPADRMVCPGEWKALLTRLYREKRALRLSVKDGGGNFCAVYAHPWALRRASGELFEEFV